MHVVNEPLTSDQSDTATENHALKTCHFRVKSQSTSFLAIFHNKILAEPTLNLHQTFAELLRVLAL